jgi:TonB family protein
VKKILLSTAVSAALVVGPAFAKQPAAPAAPKAPTEMGQALVALQKELKPLSNTMSGDMVVLLEKLEARQYDAASRARFAKVFGDPDAFKPRRAAAGPGQRAYTVGLKAHAFADDDGSRFSWSDLGLTITFDKTGRQMRTSGQWQTLGIETRDLTATVSGMSVRGQSNRSANDIWLGSASVAVDQVNIAAKDAPFTMTMDKLTVVTVITPRAKAADLAYDFRIKSIKAAGEQVDGVRMAMRFNGIDIESLEAFSRDSDIDQSTLTPEQQLAVMVPRLRKIGSVLIRNGGSIDIQEISAGYKGNRAVIKGRVAMPGAKESDLDSMASFMKKVHASFEVRVPVALIKDIANNVARKQVQSQNKNGQAVSEEAVQQAGQSFTDVVLGKALGEGYARMDKDTLVSTIVFSQGKLTVNGKALALPAPKSAAVLPSAVEPTRMRAREISEGCVRAELPADAQAKGETLRTTVEVAVGADGKVRDVRLLGSSGSRSYDAAVVKSAASCRWVPALAGGKEVEAKVGQQHLATPAAPQAAVTTLAK